MSGMVVTNRVSSFLCYFNLKYHQYYHKCWFYYHYAMYIILAAF